MTVRKLPTSAPSLSETPLELKYQQLAIRFEALLAYLLKMEIIRREWHADAILQYPLYSAFIKEMNSVTIIEDVINDVVSWNKLHTLYRIYLDDLDLARLFLGSASGMPSRTDAIVTEVLENIPSTQIARNFFMKYYRLEYLDDKMPESKNFKPYEDGIEG